MNYSQNSQKSSPHLTPANLVGLKFHKDTFKDIKIALVGYCPRPNCLDEYNPCDTNDQYFIHVPQANVQICEHNKIKFLSIAHVYGGPVSAALIEELAYYQIEYVLAYGLAGGLQSKNQKIGDFYIVEKGFAADGTTPHYTNKKLIESDEFLNSTISKMAKKTGFFDLTPMQAMATDAIYREYDYDLKFAKENGCDIINCESSHLFAVSQNVGIKSTQCGVISDVIKTDKGKQRQSALSVMLSSKNMSGEEVDSQDPLVLVGKIVEFYVKILIPELISDKK